MTMNLNNIYYYAATLSNADALRRMTDSQMAAFLAGHFQAGEGTEADVLDWLRKRAVCFN